MAGTPVLNNVVANLSLSTSTLRQGSPYVTLNSQTYCLVEYGFFLFLKKTTLSMQQNIMHSSDFKKTRRKQTNKQLNKKKIKPKQTKPTPKYTQKTPPDSSLGMHQE